MTAAYFEDHPTDPDKVILRKPSHSTDCPNCEYHRQRAQLWRDEAYKLLGHPLPERQGVEHMSNQPVAWHYPGGKPDQCTTDKAYAEKDPAWTPMYYKHEWVGLTDEELMECLDQAYGINMRFDGFARIIEAKLKEKNT